MASPRWDEAAPWPIFAETVSFEAAQEALRASGLSDGLPLVPPTERRLEAMLAGAQVPERSPKRSPEHSLGAMPPLYGDASLAAVAYCGVLAGCRPAELPVLEAAILACLDPAFNLLGTQSTTGTAAIALIVHGPIRQALGMNAGGNCLGPGNPVNACLGRALRLVLNNIGGARPGIGDMATMGQPGKYTFCFAENAIGTAADAEFPPLHVRRGLAATASAVTVLAPSGTVEAIPLGKGDEASHVLEPLAAAILGAGLASQSSKPDSEGEQFVLLPPEMADLLVKRGYPVAAVQERLFQMIKAGVARVAAYRSQAELMAPAAIVAGPDRIIPVVTGGVGMKMTVIPIWGGGGIMSVTRAIAAP